MKISKIKIVRLPLEVSNTQKHKLEIYSAFLLVVFSPNMFLYQISEESAFLLYVM